MTDLTYSLTDVLSTDELAFRCSRAADFERVNGAFTALLSARLYTQKQCCKDSRNSCDLCNAHSAGVSILEEENGRELFRWHAIAGVFASYRWGSMPRYASQAAWC
jgi:hypothetical protein